MAATRGPKIISRRPISKTSNCNKLLSTYLFVFVVLFSLICGCWFTATSLKHRKGDNKINLKRTPCKPKIAEVYACRYVLPRCSIFKVCSLHSWLAQSWVVWPVIHEARSRRYEKKQTKILSRFGAPFMPSIYENQENRDCLSEFLWRKFMFCCYFVILAQRMRFPFNRSNLPGQNLSKYKQQRDCFPIWTEFLNSERIFSHRKLFTTSFPN